VAALVKGRMNRIALALLMTTVFGAAMVVAGSVPAGACSCRAIAETEALEAADAAFLGTVADTNSPGQPLSSIDPVTWTFAVEGVFKGDVAARQEVVSAFSSASCGIDFEIGARYLVFAQSGGIGGPDPTPRPGQLQANLCGGTRPAERNETPLGFPELRSVGATRSTHRMVPSDRTLRPGQIVTVAVEGPGVEQWVGGVDSYFERRRDDGTWRRLYLLAWYGGSRGEPTVTKLGKNGAPGGVDDLGVPATPFKVRVPPVEPGRYRITRDFVTAPGTPEGQTLAARVTVTS
jgi:hypothetical protein